MKYEQIEEKIKDIVLLVLGTATPGTTADRNGEPQIDSILIDDLGADSLDLVEIGITIENDFDIEIDDVALASFKTVGDIVDHVDGILNSK